MTIMIMIEESSLKRMMMTLFMVRQACKKVKLSTQKLFFKVEQEKTRIPKNKNSHKTLCPTHTQSQKWGYEWFFRPRSMFHPKWKRKTFRNYWMDSAANAATIVYGNRGDQPIYCSNLWKVTNIFIFSQKNQTEIESRSRYQKP